MSVCNRWREPKTGFWNFVEDVGERPPGTSLDRWPDNKGDYKPGNVRWATSKEQLRNTSVNTFYTIKGETKIQCEWLEDLVCVVSKSTFQSRIRRGWTPEDALTVPVGSRRAIGKRKSITESSKLTIQDVKTIRNIYNRGTRTQTELAEDYDVNKTAINKIVHRLTWKHVEDSPKIRKGGDS